MQMIKGMVCIPFPQVWCKGFNYLPVFCWLSESWPGEGYGLCPWVLRETAKPVFLGRPVGNLLRYDGWPGSSLTPIAAACSLVCRNEDIFKASCWGDVGAVGLSSFLFIV